MATATRAYRPLERTARYLLEDCRRLASAPDGEQEATLFRLGFKWGRRVRRRYISAARVHRSLTNAAMAMPNCRPHEPWHRGEVQAKLRDSILAGYADAKGDRDA